MGYCHKNIKIVNINDFYSVDDLEFTLTSCEQNCNKYYSCDTACYMLDKLKEFHQQENN